MKRALAEPHFLREAEALILKCHCFMRVSTAQIATLGDEDLALVATAPDNTYGALTARPRGKGKLVELTADMKTKTLLISGSRTGNSTQFVMAQSRRALVRRDYAKKNPSVANGSSLKKRGRR